ncbi:amino acid ABC transporter substrate-binding protein [Zafaria sp. Z1313]|uniref:amino acid ABC transporter substrate-binding protein n=1 Tax=Zafaria sp. Z1313 TaxID=3423202 RepID=UPI003D30246E
MNRRLLALAATASAALIALTACGGTGDDAGASPQSGGLTLAQVQDAGKLVIATEGTYRPFSFHEGGTGELTGYDVEVATAVAEKLGVEPEFQETQWDAIFAGLESGRFDVIANQVSITPAREEVYSFSEPYTVSRGVIVTTADTTDISSFADLEGKTTAQSLTSNWAELARESGALIEGVEGWAQSVALLEQGRVDATINDQLTYLDYQNTNGNQNIKVAAETEETSLSAFAFRQGSDDLVAAVDAALGELAADGTLAELSDKYFGADVSK